MHAVVVKVTINDFETARSRLENDVVPRVSGAPGFVAGYWTRSEDGSSGVAMTVWESEEAARAASDIIRAAASDPNGGVSLQDVEVREVVASA
jgi:heme-degrading monooxygenase HmoA